MEKDLEQLKKYESWFYSAIYSDYIRALWKTDMEILIPIYEKWTGKKTNMNNACGKCKLEFIKKIGKLYYKKLEEYGNTEKETIRENEILPKKKNSTRYEGKTGLGNETNKRGKKSNCNNPRT